MDHWPYSVRKQLIDSIHSRWKRIDWDRRFPWWRRPSKVHILMYAEGSSIRFDGGSFGGLTYVKALLESRSYAYVDFQVTTVHRDGDSSATIKEARKLTDLNLNDYDQVWFFGIGSTPELEPAEVTALQAFMAAPKFGGVLVTGDHASLGRSIAGQVPRAGQMRLYPAPPSSPPTWNTTLVEGADADTTYDFIEQSDDRPQRIRLKRYPLFPSTVFRRRSRPHQVFCGPDGPITLLPDHQHEGEAIAPNVAAGDAMWPTKNGYQEKPEVIAWGRIKDPTASKAGQEIGVASAYNGHTVDVGRILADSTWHHWFDINLTGENPSGEYAGFDATPAGQAALKVIDAYFLNCGVWLSPPARQSEMRNFGWWSIIWDAAIVEIDFRSPAYWIGQEALGVLGRRAPQCTLIQWILDIPIVAERLPPWEWERLFEKFRLLELPLEEYIAGGIITELARNVGLTGPRSKPPDRAPEDAVLNKLLETGAKQGLEQLGKDLEIDMKLLDTLRQRKVL